MTATETIPTSWNDQFTALKNRFPHVRDAILVAMHILAKHPDATVEDAKAQANLLGVRITAASIAGAQRLIAKQTDVVASQTAEAPASDPNEAPVEPKPARRLRAQETACDTEALIRQVVGKIQNQGNVEADRLREGIRRAIAVLQATVAG